MEMGVNMNVLTCSAGYPVRISSRPS